MAATMLYTSVGLYAQSSTTKVAVSESPTPQNVLKWTKEVLPKMERLVPKLEKIKADNAGKPANLDGIGYLVAVNHLKEINARGTRLKAAEAKRYYDLIAATVNKFYIECKSQNGKVCCMDCINHGILGIWCLANCFVARFPGD
ncbi:MAG: hypothetical protein SGI96_11175 [Bacteroidota bacterium]|nr:hypothetical protein [Bacteroidota bacterium]